MVIDREKIKEIVIDNYIDDQVGLIDNGILLPLYYTVLFLLDYSHQVHLYLQSQKKYIFINIDILTINYQVKSIIIYHDDLY